MAAKAKEALNLMAVHVPASRTDACKVVPPVGAVVVVPVPRGLGPPPLLSRRLYSVCLEPLAFCTATGSHHVWMSALLLLGDWLAQAL